MMLRLLPYDFNLRYVPGKDMHVAETSSRAPTGAGLATPEMEAQEAAVFACVTIGDTRRQILQAVTMADYHGLQEKESVKDMNKYAGSFATRVDIILLGVFTST